MAKAKEKTVYDDIKLLLKLQEIYKNLDDNVKEIDNLKEDAAYEEKKYLSRQNQYKKHYPMLQQTQKEHDELKIDLEEIKNKIEELEEKKKKIKTIKEFKAINKEIDILNKKNTIKENDIMTKSEELEFKKEKVAKIKESLDEIKEVIENKKNDLDTLINERKDDINKFTKEKEKVEKKLDPSLVRTFKRIYSNKANLAVVPVEDNVCHGCYMKIPNQVEIHVKRNEQIVLCPSCSRILYKEKSAKATA
ncbi:MAG TPA: C4-type zinc ribbon domain-containing protein [Spirochaetota bacterium]|nr:C4-type zinc ribbon domain-containing protein [Spirochaetota bacterium]